MAKLVHQSLFSYRSGLYGRWTFYLLVLGIALYASQGELQPPNGGTWQGYVLGTIAALIIIFLSLLGVRKRSYRSSLGSVQGWTSAHIYLGSGLIIVATLHSGFQFGINVHTLAYVLMALVCVSGFFGLWFYQRFPAQISETLSGSDVGKLLAELDDLDVEIRTLSKRCDSDVQVSIVSAIDRTVIPSGVLQRLAGSDKSTLQIRGAQSSGQNKNKSNESASAASIVKNHNQKALIDYLAARIPYSTKSGEGETLQNILVMCTRRGNILLALRKYLRYKILLKIWLWFHIPLTVGLIAALIAHIFAVFFYW